MLKKVRRCYNVVNCDASDLDTEENLLFAKPNRFKFKRNGWLYIKHLLGTCLELQILLVRSFFLVVISCFFFYYALNKCKWSVYVFCRHIHDKLFVCVENLNSQPNLSVTFAWA